MDGRRSWENVCRSASHVLHVYENHEERVEPVVEILSSQGENDTLFYLTDNPDPVYRKSDSEECLDLVETSLDHSRLQISPAEPYYRFSGNSDAASILDNFSRLCRELRGQGFERMVLMGDIAGSNSVLNSIENFLEYEAMISLFDLPDNITVICQYNKNSFEDHYLRRASVLHELMADGGQFIRNYWVSTPNLNCGQPLFNI